MLSEARRGKTTSLRSEPLLSLLKLSRLGAASVLREMGAGCRLSGTQRRLWYLHSTTARMTTTTSRSAQPDTTHTSSPEPTGPPAPLVCPAPEPKSVRKKIKVRKARTQRVRNMYLLAWVSFCELKNLRDGLLWLCSHFSCQLNLQSERLSPPCGSETNYTKTQLNASSQQTLEEDTAAARNSCLQLSIDAWAHGP